MYAASAAARTGRCGKASVRSTSHVVPRGAAQAVVYRAVAHGAGPSRSRRAGGRARLARRPLQPDRTVRDARQSAERIAAAAVAGHHRTLLRAELGAVRAESP